MQELRNDEYAALLAPRLKIARLEALLIRDMRYSLALLSYP